MKSETQCQFSLFFKDIGTLIGWRVFHRSTPPGSVLVSTLPGGVLCCYFLHNFVLVVNVLSQERFYFFPFLRS